MQNRLNDRAACGQITRDWRYYRPPSFLSSSGTTNAMKESRAAGGSIGCSVAAACNQAFTQTATPKFADDGQTENNRCLDLEHSKRDAFLSEFENEQAGTTKVRRDASRVVLVDEV